MLLLLAVPARVSYAQDYLRISEGKTLRVKIVEVGLDSIKYSYKNDSVIYSIEKSEVAGFRYGKGESDTAAENQSNYPEEYPNLSPMYVRGAHDAEIHYKGYNGAVTGTLLTTIAGSPLAGLITGSYTGSKMPADKNLGYPDSLLMKDTDYYKGYTESALDKKGRKVWRGFLGGLLFDLSILIALLSF